MKKSLIFFTSICFLVALCLGLFISHKNIVPSTTKPICDHCNVVLISLGTLGASHLPCYGYERNTTPNLCNFAKDNILFTHAFSNASWTLPSHFSIFTSLYPNHHNMINNSTDRNILDPKINTMAEYFKMSNYKTVYVGPPKNEISFSLQRGAERGFDTLLDESSVNLESWDEAVNQLIENNHNKLSTFLFLHTYRVHSPYFVSSILGSRNKKIFNDYKNYYQDEATYVKFSQEFLDYVIYFYKSEAKDVIMNNKTGGEIAGSLEGAKNIKDAERIYNTIFTTDGTKNFNSFKFFNTVLIRKTNEKALYTKALYDDAIYYLDKKLISILNSITNSNLANNTIIIITSDHGDEFMEHGETEHPADHLYNTTTSVPLIMYVPGVKQKKIDNLVQSIDILPTILNLTGIHNSKANFDGIDLTYSILGNLLGKKNDYLISEGPNIDTIRDDKWKLYVRKTQPDGVMAYELYDLENDPQEQINLSQKEPNMVQNLENKLSRIIYKR